MDSDSLDLPKRAVSGARIEEGRRLIEAFVLIREPKVRAGLVAMAAALRAARPGPDPTFAAITAWRRADERWRATLEPLSTIEEAHFADRRDAAIVRRYRLAKAASDALASQASNLLNALYSTIPTTPAGMLALLDAILEGDSNLLEEPFYTAIASLRTAASRLFGAPSRAGLFVQSSS